MVKVGLQADLGDNKMVQVLPAVPSFGEQLADVLSQAGSKVAQGYQQYRARTALEKLLNPQAAAPPPGSQPSTAPEKPINPFAVSQAIDLAVQAGMNPASASALGSAYLKNQELAAKEAATIRSEERKAQHKRAEKAEPELLEREQRLNHYEQEAARFERLQELFSPELESKFPSSISVGLLTKDGELRPTAAAALSPEAQEAVKLVADNLSGAKDTFGARVTNFDLQAYMKRLPTLLNSAEGRRRVLRDLRLMNKLNTMHDQGVLEIIEREGGPEKISLSQAERRYRKENAQAIDAIKKEFVSPEKHAFSGKPDAKVYSGRIIVDEETGEKFRSNGKEWVPE